MSDDRDREAVQRVLAGDVDAYEDIVMRWQGPLVRLAYRFCRDPGRAEEMAQDAFVRAWRALPRFRGESAFSSWLFAVAMNTYRSHRRRHGRFVARLEALDEATAVADASDPVLDFERESTGRAVQQAVDALPAKYRDALVLYYFHELDVAAAARSLGVPEGTLKAQLLRGRELLRKKLGRRLPVGAGFREVEA